MAKEKNKKSRIHESIMSRYRLIFVLIAAFALIIVGRLFRTTVVDAKEWNLKADSLLTIQNDLLPERGNILAADGSWLAVNVHFYEVRLDFRSTIFDEDEFRAALPALCDSLSVMKEGKTSKQWMDDFNRELAKPSEKRTRAFLIAQEMTDSEWNRLIKLPYFAKELKGHRKVSLSKTLREKRMKPYGKMAYRSIGNIVEHEDGSWHGSSGLEMALDSLLFGEYGKSKKEQFALLKTVHSKHQAGQLGIVIRDELPRMVQCFVSKRHFLQFREVLQMERWKRSQSSFSKVDGFQIRHIVQAKFFAVLCK